MAIGAPPFVAVALPLLSLLQISVRLIAIGVSRFLRGLSLLKIFIQIFVAIPYEHLKTATEKAGRLLLIHITLYDSQFKMCG